MQLLLNFNKTPPAEWYEDFAIWGMVNGKPGYFYVKTPKREHLNDVIKFWKDAENEN